MVIRTLPGDGDIFAHQCLGGGGDGGRHRGQRDRGLADGGAPVVKEIGDQVVAGEGRHQQFAGIALARIEQVLPALVRLGTDRADTDIVAVRVGAVPADLHGGTGGGLGRGDDAGGGDPFFEQHLHSRGPARDRDELGGAADLIHDRIGGRGIGPFGKVVSQRIARGVAGERFAVARDGPEHRGVDQARVIADQGGEGHFDQRRFGFRLGRDRNGLQRRGEFFGVRGGCERAAGIVGKALHLCQRLGVGDVETDHMRGKVDARLFQCCRSGARVGVAGFDPVRDEDHGGLLLGVAQGLGCGDDGVGHRGRPAGVDAVDRVADRLGGAGRRGDHGFDIRTIAAFAMPVDGQAEVLVGGKVIKQGADNLAGDDDLVDTIDLPPHRAGPVQHEDCVGWLLCNGGCGEAGCKQAGKNAFHDGSVKILGQDTIFRIVHKA